MLNRWKPIVATLLIVFFVAGCTGNNLETAELSYRTVSRTVEALVDKGRLKGENAVRAKQFLEAADRALDRWHLDPDSDNLEAFFDDALADLERFGTAMIGASP